MPGAKKTWQVIRFFFLVLFGGILPPYLYALASIFFGMNRVKNKKPTGEFGVVLGCAILPDGKPSKALQKRALAGSQLLEKEKISHLILSGGFASVTSEARAMFRFLVEKGVSPAKMLLEENAHSTYENLLFSQKILREHNVNSLIIVTELYHIGRALRIAKELGINAKGYGAESPKRSLRGWCTILFREASSVLWHIAR